MTTNTSYLYQISRVLLLDKFKKARPYPQNDSQLALHLADYFSNENLKRTVDEFISKGYLIESDLPSSLMTLKRDELVSICKELNIPSNGTKQILCDNISHQDNIGYVLDQYLHGNTFYHLSTSGKEYLDENSDLLRLHSDCIINAKIAEYLDIRNTYIQNGIYPNYANIALQIAKMRIIENAEKMDYYPNDLIYKRMFELYEEKNDKYSALKCLLCALVTRLAGIAYVGIHVEKIESIKLYLPSYRKITKYSLDDIGKVLPLVYKYINIPWQQFSFDTITNMIKEFYLKGDIDFTNYNHLKKDGIYDNGFYKWKNY